MHKGNEMIMSFCFVLTKPYVLLFCACSDCVSMLFCVTKTATAKV